MLSTTCKRFRHLSIDNIFTFLLFPSQAVVNPGVTIVVSPLLSLMEDQVWSLKNLGIEAELLSSTTERNQSNAILRMLSDTSDTCEFSVVFFFHIF